MVLVEIMDAEHFPVQLVVRGIALNRTVGADCRAVVV